jgi:hypothetical protein
MTESLTIYNDSGTIRVLTAVSRKEVFSSQNAAESIQRAVDACKDSGGKVNLEPGEYMLDREIAIASNITLQGAGRSTVLRADFSGSCAIKCNTAHGLRINDFTLCTGKKIPQSGIILDACGDSRIGDVACLGFSDYGIMLCNSSYLCELLSCRCAGNGKANIFCKKLHRGKYGDYIPNLLSNCMVYGGGVGIECEGSTVQNIVGCLAYQTGGPGFYFHGHSNSIVMSGCRTFQITGDAVVADNANELNCTGNIFCWATGNGIVVRNSDWGTICGNEVIDSGSYNTGLKDQSVKMADLPEKPPLLIGIKLEKVNSFTVTGNTIFNWGCAPRLLNGITEDNASSKNIICSNTINYHESEAVVSKGEGSVAENNVALDNPSRKAMNGNIQSFVPELTREFIELQSTLRSKK